jgi:hypothetical protein
MSTSSHVFPTSSMATSILSSIVSANTTSTIPTPYNSTVVDPPGSDPSDPSDNDNDDPDSKQNTLLYYYFFIFLILVVGVIVISCLAYHRRRKLRKTLHRNNGQNALQRDLEGWSPGGLRLFPIGARALNRRNTQQDEGFNEFGEAPPVYKPKDEHKSRPESNESGRGQSRGGLSKLPEYDEIVKDTETESEIPAESAEISVVREQPMASSTNPSIQQPPERHT